MEMKQKTTQSSRSKMLIGLSIGMVLAILVMAGAAMALGIFKPAQPASTSNPLSSATTTTDEAGLTDPSNDVEAASTYEPQILPGQYITPSLSLSANWSGEATAYNGWPILFNARLLNPGLEVTDSDLVPIVLDLKDKGASWTQAVRLEVTNDQGEMQTWPVELATEPADKLSLDAETVGDLMWSISPDKVASLAEGAYQVVAVLDTASDAADGAWAGVVRSAPVTLTIGKEPTPLTADQETEKYLLLASYEMLHDDHDAAWNQIDTLLTKQPDNLGGLSFKGDLLAMAGKDSEALATYTYAINLFYKNNPDSEEPPVNLQRKQGEMLNKLMIVEQP